MQGNNQNTGDDPTDPTSSRSSPPAASSNMRKLSKNQITKDTMCKMSGCKSTFVNNELYPKGILANVYLASPISKTHKTRLILFLFVNFLFLNIFL